MTNLNLLTNDITHKIKSVEDHSNDYASRLRVTFNNGYSLSIIRGDWSYGGESGLFEIAVIDSDNEWFTRQVNEAMFGEELYDDVKGWQTESEVKQWAIFVANL